MSGKGDKSGTNRPADRPAMCSAMRTAEDWAVELWDESHVCNGLARGAAYRFVQRIRAEALEAAAALHESINPACDHERDRGDPGAGAMAAVIEYRDKIRALKATR